jgi:hypothetical protein
MNRHSIVARRMLFGGNMTNRIGFIWVISLLALARAVSPVWAQAETITATASVKNASGASTNTPVTVVVDRFATDAERDALLAAVRSGGTAAARELLAKQRDAGTLQLGSQRASIKYAYARNAGSGRLITVITAQPIGGPGANAKTGFDLGLALLELAASGPGHGELSPAAKVRIDGQGAIVTEGVTPADTVQLSNVAKK